MLLGPAIMYTANTVLFFAGALYFLLRISPFLTLTALAPMPLASIFIQFMGRRIHERFERIQAMFSDISAQAQENFSGARLVRAFAQENAQVKAFERSNREYIRRALRLVRLMGMLWPTLEFMLGIGHGDLPAGRWTPGADPPNQPQGFRHLHHLLTHAHMAHHRPRLRGQSL